MHEDPRLVKRERERDREALSLELELELLQFHMTQKPVLRGEVDALFLGVTCALETLPHEVEEQPPGI